MTTRENALETFTEILTERENTRATLIQALHRIQKENNYLPEKDLKFLSEKLKIPLAEIYSTASFYKQFHFAPRGKNIVSICVGTACHVRGAQKVISKLENSFGIKAGNTTEDLSVTLETVGCIGCCGIAPVAVVNNKVVGDLAEEKVASIVEEAKKDIYEKTK